MRLIIFRVFTRYIYGDIMAVTTTMSLKVENKKRLRKIAQERKFSDGTDFSNDEALEAVLDLVDPQPKRAVKVEGC
jgi:hypothetical protein